MSPSCSITSSDRLSGSSLTWYSLAKTLPVFFEIGFHALKLLVNRVVMTGTTSTEGGQEEACTIKI